MTSSARQPYQNPDLPVPERVRDLLGRMTVEEKIGQTNQVWTHPAHREVAKDLVRRGLAGTLLSNNNQEEHRPAVEDLNELQRIAVEESRLGIPLIHGRDVIHGHRTVFPLPLGLAASFDPGVMEESNTIAAREAASAGVHWSYAPMIDLSRDPRWGRSVEGIGEDPYLGAQMAAAAVRGFQGQDLSDPERILACAKHFIGYGSAEGGRDYETGEITENTLRNVYLPPYRAAVQAGVASVMSAFQDLNGEPLSGSDTYLTGLLRGELGFDGFVVSDWQSVLELVYHRVAVDGRDAARLAFNAGVDIDMLADLYLQHLGALLESGEVRMERLDAAVSAILTAKFRLGLFERPYTDPALGEQVQLSAPHREAARRIAARCMVLLKNEGELLPLDASSLPGKVAVIGPLADQRAALLGSWSFDGRPEETTTVLEALTEALPGRRIITAASGIADDMLAAAQQAGLVVLVVGESDMRNGENHNVTRLELPAGQDELVEQVCALGRPVVLVVIAGRPLNLSRAAAHAQAVLWAWQPGSMGAAAVTDLLLGKAEPAGRLPMTFPRNVGQVPIYYNFKSSGKHFDLVYRPVPPGYRHQERYLDSRSDPLYPFGYGLGYTSFGFDELEVQPAEDGARVSVQVTNTGKRRGTCVAQLYVQDCVASLTRPARELKGFQRAELDPGETRRLVFDLGFEELSFYAKGGQRVVEPGEFKVWVGADCRAELEGSFRVERLQRTD